MAKINTHATGHGSKTENYTGGTSIQYNVFPNITATDNKASSQTDQGLRYHQQA